MPSSQVSKADVEDPPILDQLYRPSSHNGNIKFYSF